ncbi:MAG: transcriptional repressor [Planctomycetaceae bacterium]|nr:transcriptional repressor [Planctomycetaceae bacterium]
MSDLAAVEVAISPAGKFREYLALNGKRLTRERETIVEEVFSTHDHFDTDQLVSRVSNRTDGRRVSRATVYRTLLEMIGAGLLRKVARSQNREVFEHDYGYPQHDHLICSKCGSLTEFENAPLSRLLESVADEHAFRMTGHRLEVYGLCSECSRPPRMRHRKLDMI